MSKRNMLLGLAAGKIGDLVFYRDGGEQRTRTRVVPNNPRSQAQMAQRVRIANVSATYRLLKAVIADSFTGRPSNQSGYNAFASGAIGISPYMSREMALADVCLPAPYVVARGSIAPIPYNVVAEGGDSHIEMAVLGLTTEDTTIAAVSSKILTTYPQLEQGDVLTFVSISYLAATENGDTAGYSGIPTIVSMKIDTTNTSAIPSELESTSNGSIHFFPSAESGVTAGAIIVSRVDGNGALQTSLSALKLTADASASYKEYRGENALYEATESYGVGGDSILRD